MCAQVKKSTVPPCVELFGRKNPGSGLFMPARGGLTVNFHLRDGAPGRCCLFACLLVCLFVCLLVCLFVCFCTSFCLFCLVCGGCLFAAGVRRALREELKWEADYAILDLDDPRYAYVPSGPRKCVRACLCACMYMRACLCVCMYTRVSLRACMLCVFGVCVRVCCVSCVLCVCSAV